jgi:hypothetical protein
MEDQMRNKGIFTAAAVIVLGMGFSACSLKNDRPVLGPNEVVISDDGETVVTSTKEVQKAPALSIEWNTTKNVWRISQDLLKYYKYGGTVYVSGQLKVSAGVNNIAYDKVVGIRYTTDNWKTYKDYNGYWTSYNSAANTDTFDIFSESTIQPGKTVKYAIYYKVSGKTYWDNNNGLNYTAQF